MAFRALVRFVAALMFCLCVSACSADADICSVRLPALRQSYRVVPWPPAAAGRAVERDAAVRLILRRHYAAAAKHYLGASDYLDGVSDPGLPYQYFFQRDFRSGFASLYQRFTCGQPLSNWNANYDDFGASNDLRQSWVAAIDGEPAKPAALAEKALRINPYFIDAETTLGLLCEAKRQTRCARSWWLKGMTNAGYPMPDDVMPAGQEYPFELLLHFRP